MAIDHRPTRSDDKYPGLSLGVHDDDDLLRLLLVVDCFSIKRNSNLHTFTDPVRADVILVFAQETCYHCGCCVFLLSFFVSPYSTFTSILALATPPGTQLT